MVIRMERGEWQADGENFAWVPRAGANRLEVKAVNRFGVNGPASTVELEMNAGK